MTSALNRSVNFLDPRRMLAALLAMVAATGAFAQQQPRCDGFPPWDHRTEPKGDVVGIIAGPCFGQLFPVTAGPNSDPDAASIQSLSVVQAPRQGTFRMISLREFRYQPAQTIRGWDTVVLRLVYSLPDGKVIGKPVRLRLTSDDEYRRMKAAGELD